MGCDVLLMAAFMPELAPLRDTLGDSFQGRVGGANVVARVIGIGLPISTAGAAMQLSEEKPRIALAVGTCGAYPGSSLSIGTVVTARRLILAEPSTLQGASQFPEPMPTTLVAHGPLVGSMQSSGAQVTDVANTLAITVDDAVSESIARATGAGVEHLEAFGVATACAARGIPFGAVLGVANAVGSHARAEWRTNHRAAAHAAIAVVLRAIGIGAI
jgi:nucleoside phosphorylase